MSIGFVGMGNMGQMMVRAFARSATLSPADIVVSSRCQEKLARFLEGLPGVRRAVSNGELARISKVLFLCIKPGETASVIREIAPYITSEHLVVTITNTLDIEKLEGALPARIAKVIPSVVQTVGAGVSLLIFGERCNSHDKALLERLFSSVSTPVVIQESQARVASDLTSCGPAFLSYVYKSIAVAAREYAPDLPADTIETLVRKTAFATNLMIERLGYSFDDVIAKVSTPGGITADGIKVLEEQLSGVWEQVIVTTIHKENLKRDKVSLQ